MQCTKYKGHSQVHLPWERYICKWPDTISRRGKYLKQLKILHSFIIWKTGFPNFNNNVNLVLNFCLALSQLPLNKNLLFSLTLIIRYQSVFYFPHFTKRRWRENFNRRIFADFQVSLDLLWSKPNIRPLIMISEISSCENIKVDASYKSVNKGLK